MQTILKHRNSAVVINHQEGNVWACLYVNARGGDVMDWDITNLRWSGRTMKGAVKWATKQLGA